jgi:hypothetical protein
MKRYSVALTVAAVLGLGFSLHPPTAVAVETAPAARSVQTNKLHRLIVLTDIGAEVDDTESMVRLLLYSDVIDIQGLIATTSTWKRTSVSPELIESVIGARSIAIW